MIRLAFILIFLTSPALAGPILRVIDGDTYTIAAPWLPPELGKTLSLRVYGIDTPEKAGKAKCQREADLGAKATAVARAYISSAKETTIKLRRWDKYGGRVVGSVTLDGQSIADLLLGAGLAQPYFGGAKRSWCE